MIFNHEFIWIHFPKCAGTKTTALFRKYYSNLKEIHQDVVDINVNPDFKWHHSVDERIKQDNTFNTFNRTIIIPFRKLPNWLESRYNFECSRSPNLKHQPELLLQGRFLFQNGGVGFADDIAKRYLPDHILQYPYLEFIRTEFFAEDFKHIFSRFVDISVIPDSAYAKKVNASPSFLPKEIKDELYNSQEPYQHCPHWSAIEATLYEPTPIVPVSVK